MLSQKPCVTSSSPIFSCQECGASEDWEQLAKIFVELCYPHNLNRPLLKDYATELLLQDLVPTVDAFLHCLYLAFQQGKFNTDCREFEFHQFAGELDVIYKGDNPKVKVVFIRKRKDGCFTPTHIEAYEGWLVTLY
jgi:hypothetical protein